MQSTGQTSTQALSLTSMHGSTITYVMVISPHPLHPSLQASMTRFLEFASRPPRSHSASVALHADPQPAAGVQGRAWVASWRAGSCGVLAAKAGPLEDDSDHFNARAAPPLPAPPRLTHLL